MKRKRNQSNFCPPKTNLTKRTLLTLQQSVDLKALFQVLANETRLRMLHALVRAGELCVNDLAETLEMKPQAVSNQLAKLSDRKIVATRRNGNNIYYRIVDPCVTALLDTGLCLIEDAKAGKTYTIRLPILE